MFRSSFTQAIVLRKIRVSEIHKGLTLLTPEKGLLQALAYGACKMKSRLRSISEPYTFIKVYLYHEPVKNQYKVTDAEALNPFDGVRGNLEKFYTASLWAEVALKSYGAGEDSPALFRLLLDALTLLDRSSGEETSYLSIQFLWRFMNLLALLPDFSACARCGAPFAEGEPLLFPAGAGAAVCGRCAAPDSPSLSPGAQRYLERSLSLPLPQAVRIRLAPDSTGRLKEVSYRLVQELLETPLNTVRSGVGIL